jgi:hypothetical protein
LRDKVLGEKLGFVGWFVIDDAVARGRQYDDYLIADNFEPKLLT